MSACNYPFLVLPT